MEHSAAAMPPSPQTRLPVRTKRRALRGRATFTLVRSRLPVRLEADHLLQRLIEISLKADRAIVDEHVRRRLPPRDGGDQIVKVILPEPASHACRMARREDDDVEAVRVEAFEEGARTRAGRIPVIRVFPTGVRVEDAIQVD